MEDEPLRIAHVCSYYPPALGGVATVVQDLAEGLVERGHHVEVVTARRSPPGDAPPSAPACETANGVVVHRLEADFAVGHASFCSGMPAVLREGNFNLIHAHGIRRPHGEMAIRTAREGGIPAILHLHGGFNPKGFFKRWAYALYDEGARRGLTNQFDHFLGLTPDHLSRLENLGVSPERMTILPNALAEAAFLPGDPTAFRQAHHLGDRRIVLFLGAVNHAKRCDLLVRALPRVMHSCPDACLVLAGPDGGEVRFILVLSRELKLGNTCRWIGPIHGLEKRNALAAADVLALPSDEDAAPMVLLEALAQGTPVLASSAVGNAHILTDHGLGQVFERGDVRQLADLMVQALKGRGDRRVTGPRTIHTAREHFSLNTNLTALEDLYHRLIRQAESAGQVSHSNVFMNHSPREKG